MPPLQLNDEELAVLTSLAQPIDQRRRTEFLQAVAAELEGLPRPYPLDWAKWPAGQAKWERNQGRKKRQ